MKNAELITLCALLSGVFLSGIGGFLFISKQMAYYSLDWEIQLFALGFFIVIVSLILAKILSKVKMDGS